MRTRDPIMMQVHLSTTALVKLTADQRSVHDQIVSVNFAKLSFKLYLGDISSLSEFQRAYYVWSKF